MAEGPFKTEEAAFAAVERIKVSHGAWPGVKCFRDGSFGLTYYPDSSEGTHHRTTADVTEPPKASKAKEARQLAFPAEAEAVPEGWTPPWDEDPKEAPGEG